MIDFQTYSLNQLLDVFGEQKISLLLSHFKSKNSDVENYIKNQAIQFENAGLSRTKLIFKEYKKQKVVVGFFSLSCKSLILSQKNWEKLSSGTRRKLMPMKYNEKHDYYTICSILLGQLSKNFLYADGNLIKGKELLESVYKTIRKISNLVGGQILYLEAEDNEKINEFYTNNGFSFLKEKKFKNNSPDIPIKREDSELLLYVKEINKI